METIKPGMYSNMSNKDYHNLEALTSSKLPGMKNPQQWRYEYRVPRQKDCYDFGNVVHGVLENISNPDWVWEICTVPPREVLAKNGARSGNKYKDWASRQDKIILTTIQYDKVMYALEAVQLPINEHIKTTLELEDIKTEESFFWKEDDQLCGVRTDLRIPESLKGIVDIKTTSMGISPESFRYEAKKFGYHIRMAFYQYGVEKVIDELYDNLWFLVVRETKPCPMALYKMPYEMIMEGREKMHECMETYMRCVKTNTWPGYAPQELIWR